MSEHTREAAATPDPTIADLEVSEEMSREITGGDGKTPAAAQKQQYYQVKMNDALISG